MKNNDKELIITILFGWLGIHKFMNKETQLAQVYLLTFGLFGFGWFYDIYLCIYYNSKSFNEIKNSIKENTNKCNELNDHIEKLKNSYVNIKREDYGIANYKDVSRWNYKRSAITQYKESFNTYYCSRGVCSNAKNQPFKYIDKYFNIEENEENLEKFEKLLNDFSAAEQGKILLNKERDNIINNISGKIPFLIKLFNKKRMVKELGFDNVDYNQLYFPRYIFQYISPGGNSSMKCEIVFDIENLDRYINYLSNVIKFKKSIVGQRSLMTTSLREKIKKRDDYTCCICGNSVYKEPNLLLEIDHIIPISKGGQTTEDNLQTLCWKCNRSKGNKII